MRELGFDGYRVDTAKHFEPAVSAELKREAEAALADWRRAHPAQVLDSLPFYMVGEVYGWEPGQGREYNFGDRTVDFFANGYDAPHQLRLQERCRRIAGRSLHPVLRDAP